TLHPPTAPVTVELYDIDTTAAGTDTVAAALLPFFQPERRIGSKTFAPESLKDTVRFSISNAIVLDRVTKGTPLRVGLRLVSAKSAELAIQSTTTGTGMTLVFRGSLDTTATPVTVTPLSHTPLNQSFPSGPLADYVIVAKGGAPTSPALLAVGGVPSRRTYLRFDVPPSI